MNHRHLLPDEIDLLLDGEVGFGVAPLRAHVRDCDACRARLEEGRAVADALEALPHLAPSFDFGDRVMAQVPVFEPWYVAARDAILPWIPRSRPARVAALAFGSSIAAVLTTVLIWLGTQTDLIAFTTGAIGTRLREVGNAALHDVVVVLFGQETFTLVQQLGVVGFAAIALLLVSATVATVLGMRALATASSRRRG